MNKTLSDDFNEQGRSIVISIRRVVSFSYELGVFFLVLNVLVCALSIIGNLMVIILIKKYEILRVQANLLLANLAVIDLISVFASQVLNIFNLCQTLYNSKHGIITKPKIMNLQLIDTIGLTLLYVNVTTLCLRTIDRYIAVKHALKYLTIVTTQRVQIAIAFSWIFGAAFAIPTTIYSPIEERKQSFVPYLYLVFGAVLVTVLYVKISRVSHRHVKKINQQIQSVNPRHPNIERRGVLTVVLICITLFASYLPLTVLAIEKRLSGPNISELHKNVHEICFQLGLTLLYLKSGINPIIYFFRSETTREYTRKMLKSFTNRQ